MQRMMQSLCAKPSAAPKNNNETIFEDASDNISTTNSSSAPQTTSPAEQNLIKSSKWVQSTNIPVKEKQVKRNYWSAYFIKIWVARNIGIVITIYQVVKDKRMTHIHIEMQHEQ